MSIQVLWELTKRNNAFLVNRYGVKLSSDPYNPTGRNLQSHSGSYPRLNKTLLKPLLIPPGFIQQQAVAITATKPVGKKVNLTQIGLGFKKRARHLLKNKTAFKKAKGDPYVSFHRENLNVKAGVHRAARVHLNFINFCISYLIGLMSDEKGGCPINYFISFDHFLFLVFGCFSICFPVGYQKEI